MKFSKRAIYWARNKPLLLKTADRLGRGKGRLRLLDHLSPRPPQPHRADLSLWQHNDLATVGVGHATMLIRIGGRTILTDPVFSRRIGLGLGLMTAGPKRLIAPAVAMRDLPPVDLIVLSHAHFDHLDIPSLRKLTKVPHLITARHTTDLVEPLGFQNISELAWGQALRIGDVSVTAYPCRHWGARSLIDSHRGYNAYLFEHAERRVFFGGDTAFHTELPSNVDLAILGIGAYNPWNQSHATPEEAIRMSTVMQCSNLYPMHYDTFPLGAEPRGEAIMRARRAADLEGIHLCAETLGVTWTP